MRPLPLKPLSALLVLLLATSAAVQAQTVPTPPPAAPATKPAKKTADESQWVFSILPKSLQKNPRVEISVITEMTPAGKKLPPVTPASPAYYEVFSSGYHKMGDAPDNERTVKQEEIEKVLIRSLAATGYRPAQRPDHAPSLLIVYMWGSHNRVDEVDGSANAAQVARNILDRAALVGGDKFARKLLELFERTSDMEAAVPQHLAPGAEQIFTPEMMAFANPVEMFRREAVKNDFLLEQSANDVYYVVASAYDYASATANRRTLLWRTRMTVGAQGVSQEQTLPTLVLSAAPYFGKDMEEPEAIYKRATREGTVEVGTPVVVPPAEVDLRSGAKK